MKSFLSIKRALIVLLGVSALIMTGCDRLRTGFAWGASATGEGSQVTGVGLNAYVPPAPTPIPSYTEQLEKGNAAKVASQTYNVNNSILPDLPGRPVVRPSTTPAPTVSVSVPAERAQESRSSQPAWYNGFLP